MLKSEYYKIWKIIIIIIIIIICECRAVNGQKKSGKESLWHTTLAQQLKSAIAH
jgi:amino acid permease